MTSFRQIEKQEERLNYHTPEIIFGFIYSHNLSRYISLLKIMVSILQMRRRRTIEDISSSHVHTPISGYLNLLPFYYATCRFLHLTLLFSPICILSLPLHNASTLLSNEFSWFFFLWKINFKEDFDSLALTTKY